MLSSIPPCHFNGFMFAILDRSNQSVNASMENLFSSLIQELDWCVGVFICFDVLTTVYTAASQPTLSAGWVSTIWALVRVIQERDFQWGWSGHRGNWPSQKHLRKNTGSNDWVRLWKRKCHPAWDESFGILVHDWCANEWSLGSL